MKVTDENQDAMDCRPLIDQPVRRAPVHLQQRVEKPKTAREAASPPPSDAPAGQNPA
jgi:hypothetical protein